LCRVKFGVKCRRVNSPPFRLIFDTSSIFTTIFTAEDSRLQEMGDYASACPDFDDPPEVSTVEAATDASPIEVASGGQDDASVELDRSKQRKNFARSRASQTRFLESRTRGFRGKGETAMLYCLRKCVLCVQDDRQMATAHQRRRIYSSLDDKQGGAIPWLPAKVCTGVTIYGMLKCNFLPDCLAPYLR